MKRLLIILFCGLGHSAISQNITLKQSPVFDAVRSEVIGVDDHYLYVYTSVASDFLIQLDKRTMQEVSNHTIYRYKRSSSCIKLFMLKNRIYALIIDFKKKGEYSVREYTYEEGDFISNNAISIPLTSNKEGNQYNITYKINDSILIFSDTTASDKIEKYHYNFILNKIILYESVAKSPNVNPKASNSNDDDIEGPRIIAMNRTEDQIRSTFTRFKDTCSLFKSFNPEYNRTVIKNNYSGHWIQYSSSLFISRFNRSSRISLDPGKTIISLIAHARKDNSLVISGELNASDKGQKIMGVFSMMIDSNLNLIGEIEYKNLMDGKIKEFSYKSSSYKALFESDFEKECKYIVETENKTYFLLNTALKIEFATYQVNEIYIITIEIDGKMRIHALPCWQITSNDSRNSFKPIIKDGYLYILFSESSMNENGSLNFCELKNTEETNLIYYKIELEQNDISSKLILGTKGNMKYVPEIQELIPIFDEFSKSEFYFMTGESPEEDKMVFYRIDIE